MCSILELIPEYGNKIKRGEIKKPNEMPNWLSKNGKGEVVYEIQKGLKTHSRWEWKIKTKKWGRMATPSKKEECRQPLLGT